MIILRKQLLTYGFWNLAILLFVIYLSVTLFIDTHADAAESLQTYYLCEHSLQPTQSQAQKLHPAYIGDLQAWSHN
jgi:hypothetical protein